MRVAIAPAVYVSLEGRLSETAPVLSVAAEPRFSRAACAVLSGASAVWASVGSARKTLVSAVSVYSAGGSVGLCFRAQTLAQHKASCYYRLCLKGESPTAFMRNLLETFWTLATTQLLSDIDCLDILRQLMRETAARRRGKTQSPTLKTFSEPRQTHRCAAPLRLLFDNNSDPAHKYRLFMPDFNSPCLRAR